MDITRRTWAWANRHERRRGRSADRGL